MKQAKRYWPWLVTFCAWASVSVSKALDLKWVTVQLVVGATLVVAAFAMAAPGRRFVDALGAFRRPVGKVGYRLCALYFIGAVGLYILLNPQNWSLDLPQVLGWGARDPLSLVTIVFVPVYEEFFFRGALQAAMLKGLGKRFDEKRAALWSIYLCALVFWLFHAPVHPQAWDVAWQRGGIPLSPGPFFLGLICGWLAVRDRSIWSAIGFHALANLLGPLWAGILPPSLVGLFYSLA